MRRTIASALLLAFAVTCAAQASDSSQNGQLPLERYNLVPYPQKVTVQSGTLTITSTPDITLLPGAGAKEKLGLEQLQGFFQKEAMVPAHAAKHVHIVLGSIEDTRHVSFWLSSSEARALRDLNSQGYVLQIGSQQIVIMGRTGQGTLYGVQTLLQMLSQSEPETTPPALGD